MVWIGKKKKKRAVDDSVSETEKEKKRSSASVKFSSQKQLSHLQGDSSQESDELWTLKIIFL